MSAKECEALPRLEGVDHHFEELPGLRIHVAEAGSGTLVLLLHGFPQHWWEWRKIIPANQAKDSGLWRSLGDAREPGSKSVAQALSEVRQAVAICC